MLRASLEGKLGGKRGDEHERNSHRHQRNGNVV